MCPQGRFVESSFGSLLGRLVWVVLFGNFFYLCIITNKFIMNWRVLFDATESMFTDVTVSVYIYAFDEAGYLCILGGVRGATAPTGAGLLNPPMGHSELEEFYEDAALREVEEESGLKLDISDLIDMGSWPYAGGSRVSQHFVVAFPGLTADYEIGEGDGENEQFHWLRVRDIKAADWAWSTGANALKYAEVAGEVLESV